MSPKVHQRDAERTLEDLEREAEQRRAEKQDANVLRLTDGLWFGAGPESWALEPLRVAVGSWVALVPGGEEPVVDPATLP